MRTPFFAAMKFAVAAGKFTVAVMLASSLAACTAKAPNPAASGNPHALTDPGTKIVDFQSADCERIWEINDAKSTGSALYWLGAMDCAVRLSPAQARAEARRWPADDWQSAFKQGVLLANGNVTPVERRQFMLRLDAFSRDYPAAVRPLIQLWRDNQLGLLQLSGERTRYYHLQQSSDAQLDELRQQLIRQNNELRVIRRKLETLTDIERQLSSRRSSDSADSDHNERGGGVKDASSGTPDNTTEDATQP